MILSFLAAAHAQEPPEPIPPPTEGVEPEAPIVVTPAPPLPPPVDISRHRAPFDVLADRAIGTVSMPVAFNWRRSPVHVAGTGSFLFELNNFNSARVGALARVPSGGLLLEFGASYAEVWDTPSSRLLALTPYRQPGRPDRLELDFSLGLPLAEGVVTSVPRFFPAVQMVFMAYADFRYGLYPNGFREMRPGQVATSIVSPVLTPIEIDNLDGARLDAMQVDLGRYAVLVGFGNDVYFKPGLFLSPRFLLAVPLLAPVTQTELWLWADFSLAIGVAL